MKNIAMLLTFLMFTTISNLSFSNCDLQTASIVFQEGRTWALTRTDADNGVQAKGTITFDRKSGGDICRGRITQSSDGAGLGLLTQTANDATPNYNIVFTYEAPDPAGRTKLGGYMVVQPAGAGAAQRVLFVRKPDGGLKLFNLEINYTLE